MKQKIEMRVRHLVAATVPTPAIEELLVRALGAPKGAEVSWEHSCGMTESATVQWEAADSVRLMDNLPAPEARPRRMAAFQKQTLAIVEALEKSRDFAKKFGRNFTGGEDLLATVLAATNGMPDSEDYVRPNDPTWIEDYREAVLRWLLCDLAVVGGA